MIDIATGAKLASTPMSGPSVLEWSADSRRVSRQVFAHRASEITGRLNLAAIIDPPGDLQHGPRPGATVCVVGQPRALPSFPDADPHSLTWSPDGSRLLVIHDFIDWIHP